MNKDARELALLSKIAVVLSIIGVILAVIKAFT